MRIRKIVSGTAEHPRMTVFRSNKQIYVQFIDDLAGVTLATASSLDKEVAAEAAGKNKIERGSPGRKTGRETRYREGYFDRFVRSQRLPVSRTSKNVSRRRS